MIRRVARSTRSHPALSRLTSWRTVSLAMLLLAGLASPAMAQLRDSRDETLVAADGTVFVVTTGFVVVPESRLEGAQQRTIELAVARVRRAGAANGRAHVMLAGGPGDSGVNLVLGMARQGGAALAQILDGDLIGIDQRGTGRSRPSLVSPVLYGLPPDGAGDPVAWLPQIERVSRLVAADVRSRGIQLEAYNTRESADDVEAVRLALGHPKLTLWGRSYGSHLALATLARHPGSIDRMVLVSPEGPDHTWKRPALVDAAINRISERAGLPDLPATMRRVIARLREKPAAVSVSDPATGTIVPVTLGAFEVQWLTAQALGDPRTLATIPAAFREMDGGDFRRMAQVALMRRSRLGVESAMKQMMDASSGASAERRQRIAREATSAILGDAINFPSMHVADAWAPSDLGDAFRRPVLSDVPTLILVGDFDPRTPLENGREVAETLSRSHLVVIENATHQFDLFGSAQLREVIAGFIRGASPDVQRVTLPPVPFQK